MSIDSIKSIAVGAIKSVPEVALRETNKIGNFVIEKLPFTKDKADQFIKEGGKMGKNTAIGAAVIATALALAVGCIKTIHSKVCDAKKQK